MRLDDATMFNLAKIFAVVIGFVSTMLTAAAGFPDIGWTRQQVAYAMMVNQGLTYLLLVLPQVQKKAGNIRGDSRDDR